MLSPFRMVCRDFILPEPASYVFFYAVFNLRNLLYIIDDMAYYWQPDSKVQFSDEMTAWMQSLRAELDGITDTIPLERFLQAMADAIAGAGNYAFRDMFYGFITFYYVEFCFNNRQSELHSFGLLPWGCGSLCYLSICRRSFLSAICVFSKYYLNGCDRQ